MVCHDVTNPTKEAKSHWFKFQPPGDESGCGRAPKPPSPSWQKGQSPDAYPDAYPMYSSCRPRCIPDVLLLLLSLLLLFVLITLLLLLRALLLLLILLPRCSDHIHAAGVPATGAHPGDRASIYILQRGCSGNRV